MTDIKKLLGFRIRELRKLAGFTQEVLAEKSSLSVNFIGSVERGIRTPTIKTLQRIASVLGATMEELFQFPPKIKKRGTKEQATQEFVYYLKKRNLKDIKLLMEIGKKIFECSNR